LVREVSAEPELIKLLEKYRAIGGVLDYVFLEPLEDACPERLHRAAALEGMAAIDRRLEQWAIRHASTKYPIEMFFRVHWDESKLAGRPVSFSTFRGTDDVEPKPHGQHAWGIPNVDGYKTAFFHPPYGLQASDDEQATLFVGINRFVLGEDSVRVEITEWSTDWSDYFEAGHEWWGAFYWTIRRSGTTRMTVVGASSTD
jgi:hypothetical protein